MLRHLLLNQTLSNVCKLLSVLIICFFTFQNTSNAQDIPGFVHMGEYGGSSYYCSMEDHNLSNAQALVAQHGGHLLTINSWEENAYVSTRIMGNAVWLGYSNQNSNSWQWMSGQSSDINNWASDEPNGSGYGAVMIKGDGYWKDRYHGNEYEVVMEIPQECIPTIDICNHGTCAVNLYDWVSTGDIFLTTLNPGQCHQAVSEDGHSYRIVDTVNIWGSLTIDEQYTVSGCNPQTWNVAPCAPECTQSTIAHWNLDACTASSSGSNMDYSEFTPTFPYSGRCFVPNGITASNLYRGYGAKHSCAYPRTGQGGEAVCVASSSSTQYRTGDPLAVNFDITITPNEIGKITAIQFWETAPTQFNWVGGDSGTNNYPKKYGIRVLKNGNEIFRSANNNTTSNWTFKSFDFSNDPAFEVTTTTTFTFELFPYDLASNGAQVAAWELDDIAILGCCSGTSDPEPSDDPCPADCPIPNLAGADYLGTLNGNRYYRRTNDCITYSEAYNYAQSIGGHLLTINSAEENNFISNNTDGAVWIGFTDAYSEGNFSWNTGEPVNYTNWEPGQPNNSDNDQDYTVIYNGKWYDIDEDYHAWSVVEIPCDCCTATLNVCNDGECAIDLLATDDVLLTTVNPGECFELSAANGQTYRVVDRKPDWDHISFDEHYTITSCEDQTWNLNPCPSDDSCPEQCSISDFDETRYLGTFNGNRYYKKSTGTMNYQDALAFAESIGGHLATISSADENEFLKNATAGNIWLGLSDANSEGNFEWNTGESLDYTNWSSGQPNNGGYWWNPDEDYAKFNAEGKWYDVRSSANLWCVVEIPCDCCTPTLTVCNEGVCTVNLLRKDPAGDTFIAALSPDDCLEVVAQDGTIYHMIHQELSPGSGAGLTDACISYTVTGCEDQIWAAEPICPLPLDCFAEVHATISFPNRTDGAVIAEVDGGIPPYSYVWSTGDTTQIVEGLGAGTYTVRISDATGTACASSVTLDNPIVIGSFTGGEGSRNVVSSSINTQELLVTPIELLDFSVRTIGEDRIQIDWETLNEFENQKFVIERSQNGTDFQAISTIEGKGSIHEETSYDHMDNRPIVGRNYYRIKQVYFNGYFEYTDVESAIIKGDSQKEIFVYPNPTPDVISIRSADAFKQNVLVKLINDQGRELLSYPIERGESFESIDLTVYPPGIYYVHLIYEHEKNTVFKVVKSDY